MSNSADIIVIGGGMAGVSVAANLCKYAHVIVLETEKHIGYHSTSRSAAMFIRNYGSSVLRELNKHSYLCFSNLQQLLDQCLLSTRAELLIAGEEESEQFESYLKHSDGIEQLDREQALALCPALIKEKIHLAAIEREAADIDVDLLLQFYASQFKSSKGELHLNSQVDELTFQNQQWRVKTTSGIFSAPIIINAAGAWSDVIAEKANLTTLGMTPKRRSAALIKVEEYSNVDDWPLVVSASESWYAKPQSGLLIVSPADEEPVQPHDAWPEDMVLAEGLHRFQQYMNIAVNRIEHSWAGLRTFVEDNNPVVGFSDQAEGFFWLAGQGGYGIQTAPVLAQLSADLILNCQSDLSDDLIKALSPNRELDRSG